MTCIWPHCYWPSISILQGENFSHAMGLWVESNFFPGMTYGHSQWLGDLQIIWAHFDWKDLPERKKLKSRSSLSPRVYNDVNGFARRMKRPFSLIALRRQVPGVSGVTRDALTSATLGLTDIVSHCRVMASLDGARFSIFRPRKEQWSTCGPFQGWHEKSSYYWP